MVPLSYFIFLCALPDSSDHTEGTLPSRSFGFVRFGDGSSGSAEHSDDAPGLTGIYSAGVFDLI